MTDPENNEKIPTSTTSNENLPEGSSVHLKDPTWHFTVKKSRFITGKENGIPWQSWVGMELGGEFPYSQKDETIQKILDESDILLVEEIHKERDAHSFDGF